MVKQYPRPQMKRENWFSLNGNWTLDGNDILVPFPPQSELSGYKKDVPDFFTYEKRFVLPEDMKKGRRLLLHFGAVDQVAEVLLNGKILGKHEGGYLPFCFDVTTVINNVGENLLVVNVEDTLSPDYPYGKQRKNRGGMWYTPVSGIWQSVWMEVVPENYIEGITLTPDLKGVDIIIAGQIEGFSVTVNVQKTTYDRNENKRIRKEFSGRSGRLDIPKDEIILWTPENPTLYEMVIETDQDKVETYFALRTISIEVVKGVKRVCLNKEPIFLHGVLDQGYFQEGIYTPKEAKEYDRDILRMKELGINLLRKHAKIEPEYFYYACDKLGMLVMQDMVNSGEYRFIRDTALPTIGMKKRGDRTGTSGKRKEFFKEHVENTVKQLFNHPCLVAYTIFNEGWGQFHSDEMYEFVKSLDATRLVDATSGWFAQKKSDFDSEHIYFRVKKMHPQKRPMLMSECGGYTLAIKGHTFSEKKSYGYGACENEEKLTDAIINLYEKMIIPAIPEGMCGCVYTQLSDVEDEMNGFYTYDREICKVEKVRMEALAIKLQETMSL